MSTVLFLANGTSIHSYKWISFFSKKYHIIWLSTDGFDQAYKNNKNIHYVDCRISKIKTFNLFFGIFKIISLSIKFKIDLIHVHYLGYQTLLTSFVKNNSIILTAWGSDIVFAENSILKRFFLKYYLNRANIITCDSHHMQNKINSIVNSIDKVKLINFGIDTSFFVRQNKNQFLKGELGINTENIIISTRNHENIYDIQTLIHAVCLARKTFPDIVCLIAGSGSKTKKLKKQVRINNLDNNVKFVGRLSINNIRDYLSISSMYVSTSLSDGGIAASTAEAMSSEVPCIVTDVADNSDWIIPQKTGLLFEAGDYNQLAKLIIKLITSDALSISVSKKARQMIIQHNDYNNEMKKMNYLYDDLFCP
jgi:L-malate glycosyltransferase